MQSPEPFDTKHTPEEVEVEIETDDFPPLIPGLVWLPLLKKRKLGTAACPHQHR
jgi:hypothetical protein